MIAALYFSLLRCEQAQLQQQQCQLNEVLSAISDVILRLDTKKIALPEGVGIGDEADQNIVGAQSRLGVVKATRARNSPCALGERR